MARGFLLLVFGFWAFVVEAQVPLLDWVQTFGSNGSGQHDEFHDMAVDSEGNIYVTATILNASSTNPWPVTTNGSIDIIIMKLDADGNTIWTKQIGGPEADGGFTFPYYGILRTWIQLVKDEYLIIKGVAGADCDLDPGSGTFITDNSPLILNTPFVMKMDLDGQFVWGKTWSLTGTVSDLYMTTDTAGGIYLFGETFPPDSIDLDPSPTEEVWLRPTDYDGDRVNFIVKLTADGIFDWFGILPTWTASLGPSPNGFSGIISFKPIPFKDGVLISQCFDGSTSFKLPVDTVQLTSQSWSEPYIAAIGPEGQLNWVGQFEEDSMKCTLMSMTTDEQENIYAYGIFWLPEEAVDIDPGPGIHEQDMNGGFMLKLDSEGNLIWAIPFSSTHPAIYDMEVNSGGVFCLGAFLGALSVETTSGIVNMTAPGASNAFILQMDTLGQYLWVGQYESNETGERVSWGRVNNHLEDGLLIGFTIPGQDPTDVDPGPTQHTIVSNGGYDFFVERLEFQPVAAEQVSGSIDGISAYPNPCTSSLNIRFPESYQTAQGMTLTATDMLGRLVSSPPCKEGSGEVIQLDVSAWPPSLYHLHCTDSQGNRSVVKVVKE